jgi:hypothetical protein
MIGGEANEGTFFGKVFKDQCCPRCHKTLDHDLKPLPETLPVSLKS